MEVGEPTLRDIFDALARPGRDPREDLPKPIFKRGVLKLEDLETGMELKGTVLNVVDFGAFVDIGLKDSGLVHISQLANRYVKSPHDVVSVGDVVTVWVMSVDQERKRVSLTMVKPGTERARAPANPEAEAVEVAEAPRAKAEKAGNRRGGRPPRRGEAPRPAARIRSRSRRRAEAPRPGTNRIPGPPMRLQQGGGGARSRTGPRPGRSRRTRRRSRRSRWWWLRPRIGLVLHPAPASPAQAEYAPAAPLQGRPDRQRPLRTFGQLKQLFEAREKGDEPETPPTEPQTPPEPTNPGSAESSES